MILTFWKYSKNTEFVAIRWVFMLCLFLFQWKEEVSVPQGNQQHQLPLVEPAVRLQALHCVCVCPQHWSACSCSTIGVFESLETQTQLICYVAENMQTCGRILCAECLYETVCSSAAQRGRLVLCNLNFVGEKWDDCVRRNKPPLLLCA